MMFVLELAAAFFAGTFTALAAVYYGGRWYLRRRLGGMVDLIGKQL